MTERSTQDSGFVFEPPFQDAARTDGPSAVGAYSQSAQISRLRVKPTPLHPGFGFGAIDIQARSMAVSAESQQRRKKLLSEIGAHAEPRPSSSAKAKLDAIVAQANSSAQTEHETDDVPETLVSAPWPGENELESFIINDDSSGLAEKQSDLQNEQVNLPVPDAVVTSHVARVSRAAVFCAWAFDLLCATCVLFAVAYGVRTSVNGDGGAFFDAFRRAFSVLSPSLGSLDRTRIIVAVVAGGTALSLWSLQFLSVLFFRTTIGRFFLGIRLDGRHSRILAAPFVATLEIVGLGGLLSLPLALLAPTRYPFMPWLRLEARP